MAAGQTPTYADTQLPIRAAIADAHTDTLNSFARPGTWYTAAQRCEIVANVRAARAAEQLQEMADPAECTGQIGDAVRDIARTLAVSTNALDRSFYDAARDNGLSDTDYVEIVGIVARVVGVDIFARAIGVTPRTLPRPADGTPRRLRPHSARAEGAWVDTVPCGRRGKDEALQIYGSHKVEAAPFIYRALSLVPDEARGLIQLGAAQYVEIENFMNLDFTFEPTISRQQVELLAARVSAINECFY